MFELQRFGGGGGSSMHPVFACALILLGILILVVSRRMIIVPLFVGFFLIPMTQVLVLGAFHFPSMRILILFAWVRVIAAKISSKTEIFSGGINRLDKVLILSTVFSAVDFLLLFQEQGALVNQLGNLYTVFGLYFLMRFLIRDQEDVEQAIRVFAYIGVVIALLMVSEQLTGHSAYAFVGGTIQQREGSFRAQAAFGHPVLAGTFGAMTLPFFIGLLALRKSRFVAWMGIAASTLIALASASSTSILAYSCVLFGLGLWPLRKQMRALRWLIVLALVSLHMVMKAPVWALIGRIDVVGGNSASHRFELIDNFIRHFGDWWMLGVKSTTNWGWDMFDLANQYVAVGEVYGLVPFIFFIAIIVYGFRYAGMARKAVEGDKRQELFFWTLGLAMFANVAAFFGISYFDQTMAAWYATLAIICASTAPFMVAKATALPDGVPLVPLRPAYQDATPEKVGSQGVMANNKLPEHLRMRHNRIG